MTIILSLLAVLPCLPDLPDGGPGLDRAIEAVRSVGLEGKGNGEAASAWRSLVAAEASSLPAILAGMDGASPVAANWLRLAFETAARDATARGAPLPLRDLESFVLDRRHLPKARRLAYEWLAAADATVPSRLLPTLADDPDPDIRGDLVRRLVGEAERVSGTGDREASVAAWRAALGQARDPGQVSRIAEKLRGLGESVDLALHFGFVRSWKVIGPFDNTGSKAFDVAYPPEDGATLGADVGAELDGKSGKVRWQDHATEDEYGLVDLNRALGKHKGAVAYALAEFPGSSRRAVEIRLGCATAWKLWLNGAFLFGQEEYHHGMELDQFRVRGELREGPNRILLKVCQNEQSEDWAQVWQFQLRVCDEAGTAVLPADAAAPAPAAKPEEVRG